MPTQASSALKTLDAGMRRDDDDDEVINQGLPGALRLLPANLIVLQNPSWRGPDRQHDSFR